MKIKILSALAFVMCMFLPHSMAASWQEVVDANTQETSCLYTVYTEMPVEDYKSAWKNVPGWELTSSKKGSDRIYGGYSYRDIFKRTESLNDDVIEEFRVDYHDNYVFSPEIIFLSKDKKIINRIFNYMTVRINKLTNQSKKRMYNKNIHKLNPEIMWKTHNQNGQTTYIGIDILEQGKDGYYRVILWKSRYQD